MAWFSRIKALFRRERLGRDHDDEMQFHLAMREQWNVNEGMERDEARRDARVRFGSAATMRERMSEIDLMTLPQTVLQDLRYGVRMLVRQRRFTVAAVLALALGIGANTAAFTAYKALIKRKLDARDSGRMVNLSLVLESGALSSWFSYPDYEVYRDKLRSLSGVIVTGNMDMLTMSGAGAFNGQRIPAGGTLAGRIGLIPPNVANTAGEAATVYAVSENYFSVLGVGVLRGRTFDQEGRAELMASPAVIISENYWQRRFAGDPAVLGKTIRLHGVGFAIIGIAQHDFVGTSVGAPDFWMPMSLITLVHPEEKELKDREDLCCRMYGRLADGATIKSAQAEMTALAGQMRNLHEAHSDLHKPLTALIWPGTPFPHKLPPGLQFSIALIMVAVGMVLVIACANVASLQLARAASRQGELRMRLSLGASRGRLIRQLLTESALLAIVAGALALVLTWALLKVAANLAATALPAELGVFVIHINPDLEIFAYVFAVSMVAGVLFGLAPALESSRSALPSSLKSNAGTSPMRSRRLRDVLIGAQVAVSVVLMVAGSMLIRSSLHALHMPTGYDGEHVVNLELQFPDGAKYTAERKLAIVRELRSRITALPDVAAVTSARAPDGDGVRSAAISLNGEKPSERNTTAYEYYTYVQPNYFETLGIPFLYGHGFQATAGQLENSIVLSEGAAKSLWPGQNPIGRSLRMGTERSYHAKTEAVPDGQRYQVVGVTRDTRGVTLDGADSEQIYLPMPEAHILDYPLLVRTKVDPKTVIATLGPMIGAMDPDMGASSVTLEELLRQTGPFMAAGLAASIASTIGVLGLFLAAMGIYGTVSYIVELRTREVGIRMALGAKKRDVLTLMLRESARPVMGGLAAGLLLALGATYLLRAILYGLGLFDAVSFLGVAGLFLLIALFAAYVPSRRAMQVEPVVALRYE